MDQSQQSDEQLAQWAAREGSNGPAFNELFARHRERVWRICFRLLGNEADTSDAAQDVFVSLFLKRGEFRGRSKYTTWLHAIAVRTCLEFRRKQGRRRKHEAQAAQQIIAHQEQSQPTSAQHPFSTDLMQMLDTLDEEDRALVILKYGEGCSYPELAEMFGMTQSACKMRVSRACDKLRERFPNQSPAAE